MATVKKSWWDWFYSPNEKAVVDDSVEAARAMVIKLTPHERIDRLEKWFVSELAKRDAGFEAFKQEVLDAQKEQFEALVDAWTAPEVTEDQNLLKESISTDLQYVKKVFQQLRSHNLTSSQITDLLNAKLPPSLRISSSSVRSYWSPSDNRRYRNLTEVGLAAKQVLQEVESDTDEQPPFPEPTGDYKKIRWILRRLYKRFTIVAIAKHINKGLKAKGKQTHNVNTFSTLKNNVYQWVSEDGKHSPVLKEERLPPIIELAYQLLTSAEQYKYNELFEAPK